MSPEIMKGHVPKLSIESVERLSTGDLHELCDAAEAGIMSGGGFGWLSPPPKSVMEDYWRGVLMIPERHLIVARTRLLPVAAKFCDHPGTMKRRLLPVS